MSDTFNVYCDESCHLEKDHQKAMVLGAVWCAFDKTREIAVRLREIKQKHGLSSRFEVKWTKVSPAKTALYLDLIDYFFDDDDLHFRALIVPDKSKLRHDAIPGQDHDAWYYKMYFDMLKVILSPDARYRVYLDIKDTRGAEKICKLHQVLCNNGLTNWKNDEVRKTDVTIAKNYLKEHEIDELNRIVVMWLDFAEDQARRRKQIFLKDWEQKLDEFLRFNERQVLPDAGKVGKKEADDFAQREYERFSARRREYKETMGEEEIIKQLEEAAKRLPEKSKRRKK